MIPTARLTRGAGALALASLLPAAAAAQAKALTLDDIYDPDKKVDFEGNVPRNLAWIDDAHYLWPKTDSRSRTEMLEVEAETGAAEPLFDVARMEATLGRLEGVAPEEAPRLARPRAFTLNAKRTAVYGSRVGIGGWSYGGFMVSYALTHSKSFAMGIAGGTVSDWRDYDSIYTERYMRTPEHNPEGYRRSSPRWAAKDLHGQLMLVHGAIDDNVHPQNTMQLAYELQKAGQPFRLMLYPKSRHGVTEPALVKHLRATMLEFTEQTLLR